MHITELYVYPIKSLRGIRVPAAVVGPQGLRHDRRFMLVTPKPTKDGSGTVVWDRVQIGHVPACGLFSQELDDEDEEEAVVVRFHPPEGGSSKFPEPLRVPLAPATAALARIDINLHGSAATRAYDMGAACDAWFSACLGRPVVLAYLGDGRRPVLGSTLRAGGGERRRRWWRNWAMLAAAGAAFAVAVAVAVAGQAHQSGWTTASTAATTTLLVLSLALAFLSREDDLWLTFTDVAPLLVTSEVSRQAVNAQMAAAAAPDAGEEDTDVPMYKFRPNVVVDGTAAWDEDFWAELAVHTHDGDGDAPVQLLLTANCGRCASLNVDYATGKPAQGALGTVLKRLMKDRRVDKGLPYAPVFGRYASLGSSSSEGRTLAVGDAVQVVRRTEQRPVWDWPL